ncbi:universal stress protein [Kitasatospora sp. NPDC002227]|uniref:universal stress protein n=1 Tax=Kitasatospora sp. NPDC002227 TaxID=3154773 RepID=UPI00331F1A10
MKSYVLAGVDGSPHSDAAARWAAAEAQRRGTGLRLLHCWPWLRHQAPDGTRTGDLRAAARQALDHTVEELRRDHPGLAVEAVTVTDSPVEGLVIGARESELLVLGTRGLGGFAELLLGSVSLAVAARAGTPTVLVRATEEGAPGRLLLGLDARQPAAEVLEFAVREARLRGVPLHVVHGWSLEAVYATPGWFPPQVDVAELQTAEETLLTEALAPWQAKYPEVEFRPQVRRDGAVQALLEPRSAADLVIIGRRERRHDLGLRLGAVAHAVLHHAAAPVAVVPHD